MVRKQLNAEGVAGYMLVGYTWELAMTIATERFIAARTNRLWYEVCLRILAAKVG